MKHFITICFLTTLIFSNRFLFSQDSGSNLYNQDYFKPIFNSIIFDGKVDKNEWINAQSISLSSHWPEYSESPNSKTLMYAGYDSDYLFFAAICYDDPYGIQAPTFERDILSMAMDQFTIIIDTYNDNENALLFAVTPSGSRIDLSLFNDAQGENPIDISWNSFWEAKVSRFSEGWMTEVRIPFSSLRFQPVDGKVKMGLILYRYIARDRQMDIFPKIKPNWGFWSFCKPSQAQDIVIVKKKNKKPWFTSPFVLANSGYHHEKESGSPNFNKISDNKITAGLDIQHAITDNMNLDLTLNTDFAQVEADDQVVNLSRFSLFFPEKRRFFLERSSILDFRFENQNRLFYSRKIGINNGSISPLLGGARIVGRIKDFDVGLMSMQSRGTESFSSENFGIIRLRKKVSSNNSYIGAIVANRMDIDGNIQMTTGFDGIFNLFGDDYLKMNVATSYNSLDNANSSNFLEDRKRLYFLWENRSQVGFNYSLSYSQVDENYMPSLGFEDRSNFKSIGDRIGYGWFMENNEKIRFISTDIDAKLFLNSATNQLESYLLSPSFNIEWVKNNRLLITFNHLYDKVPNAFNLSSDIVISPDLYINNDLTLSYNSPPVDYLNANWTLTYGGFYGGKRLTIGVIPNYVISKYISVGGFYQYNRIDFADQLYNAHIGRLKISTSLNVKLSMNAFVQINSLSKINAINFRLRYNSKDGNDLYLVYNETLNGEGKNDIIIPYSDFRGLTLKYIHTFHL